MPQRKLSVSKYMTSMPHCIEPNQTLFQAQKRMLELRCRHLPVRSSGHLIGVLSERDILFVSGFEDIDLGKVKVADAMTSDPYTVRPETALDEVAAEMARNRYGSAMVVDDSNQLVGIFTDTDALRALAQISSARPSRS